MTSMVKSVGLKISCRVTTPPLSMTRFDRWCAAVVDVHGPNLRHIIAADSFVKLGRHVLKKTIIVVVVRIANNHTRTRRIDMWYEWSHV